MLATENLKDDRAPDCAPSAAALASASAAYATSTISPGGSDDGDCDDEPAAPSSTPASTPKRPKGNMVKGSPAPSSTPDSTPKGNTAEESPASPSSSDKPEPSSGKKPYSTPSSSPSPSPSSSPSSPAATSDSSLSSGGLTDLVRQVFSGGIATFYTQNGVKGACGQVHSDDDVVAALQTSQYAGGKHCGQYIQVLNKQTKTTKRVLVADECPTCDGSTSVDFSKGAFKALGGTVEEGIFDSKYIHPLASLEISDRFILQSSGVSVTKPPAFLSASTSLA